MCKVRNLNWPFQWFLKHGGRTKNTGKEPLPIDLRSCPSNLFSCAESELYCAPGTIKRDGREKIMQDLSAKLDQWNPIREAN